VGVYLKAKDSIEKAKRVQKKSAAAPGSYRPGGSDRATVSGDLPTGGRLRTWVDSRLGWGQPIGAKPTVRGLPTGAKPRVAILTNVCVIK